MIELKDTVEMMNSTDYKERFKAEYYQLVIRYKGLKRMVEKWDMGKLEFNPTCARGIYDIQLEAMSDYIKILADRAIIEKIDLESEV